MRKLFTHSIKVLVFLLATLAFFQVNAQKRLAPLAATDCQFTIENDVQLTDRTYQFELWLKDTDSGQPFELSLVQAGIWVNSAIINGGTLTATINAGSSQLVAVQQPTSISYQTGTPNGCIKIAAKSLPGCGAGTVLGTTGLGTRYCTVTITNTVAFAVAQPNLAFCFSGVPYLQTKIYQYVSCVSTQVTADATNCISHATNPTLNAVPVITTTTPLVTIGSTSATLLGTVNANSTTVTTLFDLGLTTAYTEFPNLAGTPPTVTGSTVTSVSYNATGLLPNTLYHYRLKGTYSGGTIYGADQTFTTAPVYSPPTVNTTAASSITFTGANVNGTVNANNASTAVTFEYGLTTAYGSTVPGVPTPVTGSTLTSVTAALTGLSCGTLYHYRCVGVSLGGTTQGADMTFTTTAGVAPTANTTAATSVSFTTATVNGTINANGTSTTVQFEYGLTTAYASGTVAGTPSPVTGSTLTSVSANLTGLTANTTYHYRVKGTNCGGLTNGSDMTFTTPPLTLPTVVTNAATSITPSAATLNGTVTANGASTAVTFEWGLTTAYAGGSVPGTPTPVTGVTPTAVSANLSGLAGNTTYHFRCVGVNSSGTAYGSDMTFVTPCPPAGQAGPITGPTQVCQGGTGYIYTVTIANATGYIWTLPIGGTITNGANTNTITVSYANNAQPGYIFVYGTSACGNGAPSQLGIAMNAPPTPTITGPASVCINSTGNVYTTQTGMTSYVWTINGGTITSGQGTNAATVTWTTAGAKSISVNYNNAAGCTALAPTAYNVTVNPLPVPTMAGPASCCTDYPVTYTTEANMTNYAWTVSAGGTITSGQGTATIAVTWTTAGAKTVSATYTNSNGCAAAAPVVKNVTVNPGANPTITGNNNVCMTSGYITYTTQSGMTGYTWTVSNGGYINFGQGTNSILVTWNTPGANWVRVSYTNASGCYPYMPTQYDVTVNPMPGAAGTITGAATICGGSTGVAYSVAAITGAASYVWTLPVGATIATGAGTNQITVNFAPTATAGNITVYANNVCGNGAVSPPFAVNVSPQPSPAGTITGVNTICAPATGVEYLVAEIPGATGYDWTLPTGATIATGANTNSITVDFAADAVTGTISVAGTNLCGAGTASVLDVTVTATPETPTVSWDGYTLTSSAATGNQWYMDGAPILGATDQTYVPSINGVYWVVVTVEGCPSAESDHIEVFVGIEDLTNSSFKLFPIPNDGKFTVSIVSQAKETYSITIYNNLGMKIFEEGDIIVNGTVNKTIDLRPIAQGVYSVVLQNSQNRIEKKILINK